MKDQKVCGTSKYKKSFLVLILSAIALTIIAYTIPAKEMAHSCIFCDIISGKTQTGTIEVETEDYVIFKDIKPASTHHYLAVPKKHIESLKVMSKDDIPLIENLESSLKELYKSKGIDTEDALFGFHLPPFISVKHLHMHGIAPRSQMSWVSSMVFKPNTYWFKTVGEAKQYLTSLNSSN